MARNYRERLGRQIVMSAEEACITLLQAIAEGWSSRSVTASEKVNIFGRPSISSGSQDFSFVSGLSSTGLRAGSILEGKAIESNSRALRQAIRQHLPVVLVAVYEHQQQLHALNGSGAFQWWATTPQEVVDRMLMAFRSAELALVPGIIAVDQSVFSRETDIELPTREQLIQLLGEGDDRIKTQSPAQQMLFGKARRRIPNWMNLDSALALGMGKDQRGMLLESAADAQFFKAHLPELIEQVEEAYNVLTENEYASFTGQAMNRSDYVILSVGLEEEWIDAIRGQWTRKERRKVAWLNLHQLDPIPHNALEQIGNKRGITVLEQTAQYPDDGLFRATAAALPGFKGQMISARYGERPSGSAVKGVLSNMLPGGSNRGTIWLDTRFTLDESNYPKHEILNQEIKRNYPGINERSVGGHDDGGRGSEHTHVIPYTVRQYKDGGAPLTRLSRFFDNTALLYAEAPEELLADPFQAIPTAPPASANFAPLSDLRETLPVYKPDLCTACGECFVYCPHSAIPPLALGLEQLIQSGIKMASKSGHQITALVPLAKPLAKAGNKLIRDADSTETIKPILESAFQRVSTQMKLEGDKKERAEGDLKALVDSIGTLPIAKTEVLFSEPDLIEENTGELFSLAIDPSACTACGLCAELCPEDALEMQEQTDELLEETIRGMDLWERLPDTSGDTLIRLIDKEDYNSLAAVLLSHGFYSTLSGGGMQTDQLPSKGILHLVAAVTETMIQSRYSGVVNALEELIEDLTSSIRQTLSNALPEQNFDALGDILSRTKSDRIPYDEVIEQWGSEEHLALIDRSAMERKVRLVRDLKNLKWALIDGPSGTGRAHYSIAMDPSIRWAGEYPWNNFTVPVVFWERNRSNFVRGMIYGQIRHTLDNIRIWRRAKLEVRDTYDPKLHDREIAELSYGDLSDAERALIPPVLLVCRRTDLDGRWEEIHSVLETDWPVNIVLFDDGVPSPESAPSFIYTGIGQMLPAMMSKNRFLLKSSLTDPNHLFAGLQEGLNSPNPALFWIFSPEPEIHDVAPNRWPALHPLANSSRAFPHIQFSPSRDGQLISSKISIEDNPGADMDWQETPLLVNDGEEEREIPYALTWADWAFTAKAWRPLFQQIEEEQGDFLTLAEYLTLDRSDRDDKIPVIYRVGEDKLKRYVVGDEVVRATEATLSAWKALQEWSGTLTEYPEKLRHQVERELSRRFEQEMDELKEEYEGKIENLETEHLEKIQERLKEKLMQMAREHNGNYKEDRDE